MIGILFIRAWSNYYIVTPVLDSSSLLLHRKLFDLRTTDYKTVVPREVQPLKVTGDPNVAIHAKSRLVLMTAVFGVSPLPPYFPMFLRSIQESGADGIIIGGDEMDFKGLLPSNVRHIPLTWEGLHELISNKLFDGTPLTGFQVAAGYKVNDVKPLFGFLFREYIQEYEFWAHVDTDMIFGDLARFMNPLMDEFDVITPLESKSCDDGLNVPCKVTYGPFTAYRNVPGITELFLLIEVDLFQTLNTTQPYAVDEWGHLPHNEFGGFTSVNYPRSMSYLIVKYRDSLPIRISTKFAFGWDKKRDAPSLDCVWKMSNGKSYLYKRGREVAFCHYEYSKNKTSNLLREMSNSDREEIFTAEYVLWSAQHGLSRFQG